MTISTSTIWTDTTPGGPKTKSPPSGASYMRFFITGGGSDNLDNTNQGGGAGCAATKIIPASTITYTLGAGSLVYTTPGEPSYATVSGYSLVANGGAYRTGGTASGGDYNFSGGNGSAGNAGGAAGPNGAGGSASDGAFSNTGWGYGGGGASYSGGQAGGSGGAGSATSIYRRPGQPAILDGSPSSTYPSYAEFGAGGGATGTRSGNGSILVEYFFE